jgi:hypothetical protein
MKHTPGPWELTAGGMIRRVGTLGYIKCLNPWIEGAWDGDEEAMANNALMAAAPELLDSILKSDDAHWTPAMRAAVKKATATLTER